ncbi:sigma-E factor negative regulatory protein [Inmirania thermothiophila]|uniref:RseA-like anti sigma(E) protein n=1 Tax=Inmirania thermothiophila TaxID=1750597 RepID=A0A3N1XZV2_9GAMM|nr:sigma-E factor negative regulatory protein [Inmirania thermothiophila]ROR32123.1 RseA-like anti sigma(E) protein [Inmirania thermothiophila]
MSDRVGEQLSAWMDGELAEEEVPLLLRRLERDEALRARWARYQLIGEALRRGLPERVDPGFADRVRQALQTEPPAPAAAPVRGRRLPWAAAAAAAAAALVAAAVLMRGGGEPVKEVPVAAAPAAGDPWLRDERALRARLDAYLVDHSGAAAGAAMAGVPPYVRIVGYEESR